MNSPKEEDVDDGLIHCWCGAVGTYQELFRDECLDVMCGGSGLLHCECGGDGLCVCHHHGEEECPGCPDCDCDRDDHDHGRDDFDDYGSLE